ncbi:T9SS type A sorting domain-containing protein [bacterium]|nr:T9SS type A sorting domain-containing protein [bacterium]
MLRKTFWFGVCLVFFSTTTSITWAAWFDTNFQYKQQITIQNGQVSGAQTDFPVLITQADLDTAFFNHVAKSTISNMDIIFTNSAEDAKLSREIVHFSSGSQELEAWVKTNLADATDTVIYMYYGYAGANEPNSTDTWSNSFVAVWHMHDTPTGGAGDIAESTANPNAGTSTSMAGNSVGGQIGNALNFDGVSDYITVANHSTLQITGTLTMSAWINLANDELMEYDVIVTKKNAWDDGTGYYLELYPMGNDIDVASSGLSWQNFDIGDFTTNWHLVTGTINNTTASAFFDGNATGSAAVNALVSGTEAVTIGRQGNGTYDFTGQLDEIRLSTIVRSAGWMATCHNNQSSPAAFYNVGNEISGVSDRYRSVGPGTTGALESGSFTTTLTIAGTTATFSSALHDIVGVGDALQYDSTGDNNVDAIAFIHARTSNTVYTVRTATGAVPTATTADQNWAVFRAYTSLFNAEAGIENTGINNTVENFDVGNRDCVTNKEVMHIACYSNGTTADVGNITWDGWGLSAVYYLKIYTPYLTTEVGTSQRHSGVWNTSAYHIIESYDDGITLQDGFIRLEGLQIYTDVTNGNNESTVYINGSTGTGTDIRVSHCILRGYSSSNNDNNNGIYIIGADTGTVYIWNNIIYDFLDANNGHGIRLDDAGFTVYGYNNTIQNCSIGIRTGNDPFIAKNNIVQGSVAPNCYRDTFDSASDYNISSDTDAPGTNTKLSTTVLFENEGGDDFHLADDDTAAKNWGVDLSSDPVLSISDDIDLETRTVNWCAGADENDTVPGTPTHTPTVTLTSTPTHSPTMTATPTVTLTATESATLTHSATVTATPSITMTSTVTPIHTPTVTPTATPTSTVTETATASPTPSHTLTFTYTPTITLTATITVTLTVTATSTITTTSTRTPEYIIPDDLDSVVVYPNPYRLDIKPEKEISFDRMPMEAEIRVYTITGSLVKTLYKNSNLRWIRWDLKNEQGWHVASGVYIYIITSNGQERKGKIAIIQ